MKSHDDEFAERAVVIHGVGLIGGSIALAVRACDPKCRIIGVGRNEQRLAAAHRAGLLDETATSAVPGTVPPNSFGIVCLPVDQIPDAAGQLLRAGCSVVTDAGSVKTTVCHAMRDSGAGRFVGSHPIAGSEHSGFEHADGGMFQKRMCVVTPLDSEPTAVARVEAMWRRLGMNVVRMSPEEHDRVLALTSHLPHILASVTAGCVPEDLLPFTGTGYRDTTRIAAGSSVVWASILLDNALHCIAAMDQAESRLRSFREALASRDAAALEQLWDAAAGLRRKL